MKYTILFLLCMLVDLNAIAQNSGTKEDREALFDYLYERTLDREAFSPVKEKTLGVDVKKEMLAVKEEVINADNDVDLYYALQKLSSARKDRHLSLELIEDGLELPEIETGQAPIRFHPDFGDKDNYFVFVSDLGKNISEYLKKAEIPSIGDQLIKINGQDFVKYFNAIEPYRRYSTKENLWIRAAYDLSEKGYDLPPRFYKDKLSLTLQKSNGKEYDITLPYLPEVDWQYGRFMKKYEGYQPALSFNSFEVFKPADPNNQTLLLWWYGFRGDLPEATDSLISYAEKNNLLHYDLIIDAIDSRGGSQGAYALARLTSKPFKTTGGNLKLSDITHDFITEYTRGYLSKKTRMDGSGRESEDDGTWVMEWLHGPVLKGMAAGQEYSNNTPFKCAHLPHYSDWLMYPAETHFTGNMVVFFGPWGGSHLSQFAAMVIENDLGYTLGMNDGGYSNTWEWEEDVVFPTNQKPVVKYMWSIGHTLSPNGEIVEGNPSQVQEFIPVTSTNYLTYKSDLLEKAHQWLKKQKK